jgi:hypothetical protein
MLLWASGIFLGLFFFLVFALTSISYVGIGLSDIARGSLEIALIALAIGVCSFIAPFVRAVVNSRPVIEYMTSLTSRMQDVLRDMLHFQQKIPVRMAGGSF